MIATFGKKMIGAELVRNPAKLPLVSILGDNAGIDEGQAQNAFSYSSYKVYQFKTREEAKNFLYARLEENYTGSFIIPNVCKENTGDSLVKVACGPTDTALSFYRLCETYGNGIFNVQLRPNSALLNFYNTKDSDNFVTGDLVNRTYHFLKQAYVNNLNPYITENEVQRIFPSAAHVHLIPNNLPNVYMSSATLTFRTERDLKKCLDKQKVIGGIKLYVKRMSSSNAREMFDFYKAESQDAPKHIRISTGSNDYTIEEAIQIVSQTVGTIAFIARLPKMTLIALDNLDQTETAANLLKGQLLHNSTIIPSLC